MLADRGVAPAVDRATAPDGQGRVAEWNDRLSAVDGTPLFVQGWVPPAPRAAVLLLHGLGEHAGRYAHVARHFAAMEIATFALDHRGHGRSGGRRGHAVHFAELVADVDQLWTAVRRHLPAELPWFLLGHSLGGLVALRYLQTHPDAGFVGGILSAPLLGVLVRAPAWKLRLAKLLSQVAPALGLANEIDPEHLSRDPQVLAALAADPLVHDRITPRFYLEMRTAMAEGARDRGMLRVPLLFLLPGDDRVVDAAVTERFAHALACDVQIHHYAGFRHEPLNDPEHERVLGDIFDWMQIHLGAASRAPVSLSEPNH